MTKFSKRVNYAPTVCELVVTIWDDLCQCVAVHAMPRHLFDLTCLLTVNCPTVQTWAFWATIPWPTLSFVSIFKVDLHFLILLSHTAFSVALHQWLEQLHGTGIFSLLQWLCLWHSAFWRVHSQSKNDQWLAPISFLNDMSKSARQRPNCANSSCQYGKCVKLWWENYKLTLRDTSCQSGHVNCYVWTSCEQRGSLSVRALKLA